MTRAGLAGLLAWIAAFGCTKASDEHKSDAVRYEAGYATLEAARPPGDAVAVLLRFDHMSEVGLDDDVDRLLDIIPDHRRVFGRGGSGISSSFDLVYVSTADVTSATAGTLVARSKKSRAELQAMLAYPGSGVVWSHSARGPIGTLMPTPELYWDEPRVYSIQTDPWIMLTNPGNLDGGDPPAWQQALPALATLAGPRKSGKLLAVAIIENLPATANVPGVGEVRLPIQMIAAATVSGDVVSLSGDMTFVSEDDARAAKSAIDSLRRRFGSFRAVKDLVLRRRGTALYWRTRASVRETAMMTGLVGNAVEPLFAPRPSSFDLMGRRGYP
jgi:hypothetical protein